jgi:hypothetical protein
VYLLRVVEALGVDPKAKIPRVSLPAAAPSFEAQLAAVADVLVQPEYVYLLRVVEPVDVGDAPKAKMPTVAFPAAEPR